MASIPEIFRTMSYGPAPEASGPAETWLEAHARSFGLFIDGEWVAGRGESFDSLNPGTGKPLNKGRNLQDFSCE